MSNSFNFFVPVELSKAKDNSGNDVMKIGGVASTPDMDSDGEMLSPKGMDVSYLLKSGYFNWNHQSKNSPKAIIGEPTKAYATEKALHVEGFLYKNSEKAQEVYDLAETLEKSSDARRLGFSIEGKVLQRDKSNSNKVLKSKITGIAITPTPKNYNTLAQIMKGEVDLSEEIVKAVEDSEFMIDLVKPSGERIMVSHDYSITIEKAKKSMASEAEPTIGDDDEEEKAKKAKAEKALTTESGAALVPESVNGSKENLKILKKDRKLTKGEAYLEILTKYPDMSPEETSQVFLLANRIENLTI